MKLDVPKQRYLFERHTVEEIRSWNQRLKYFRYFRAYGGHANDSDSLDVAISYRGEEELISLLNQLGIHPATHTTAPPQREVGVSYPGTDYGKFPDIIRGTRWIDQPGHTEIFGIPVFIWCHDDRIMISPRNGTWDVDDSTVAAAEAIEPHIAGLKDRIIDPPLETEHYLCAAKHPILRSEQSS